MGIVAYYDEIAQCNKCGFCQVACPIFRATGHESGVARGRLALLRAIIEGRLDWSDDIEAPLFDCLLCGACTSNCFPAIPTSDLLIRARSEYLTQAGRKPIHRLLFDHLLPYPDRLHVAARAVALSKKAGLSNLARALGLLRIFGRDFASAEDIVEKLPVTAFRDRNHPGVYQGSGKELIIGYFIGCGVDIIQQQTGTATLQLLRQIARQVHILDNCCCGLPAYSFGDQQIAQKLAQKNMQALASGPYDIIVTDCSSCASFLKKYPKLFSEEDSRHEAAKTFSAKVRDLTEWLNNVTVPAPATDAAIRVTYHDPCHASRGQGLVKEPRDILKKIPGIEYRELPEADWCCGGAGAYALSQYDLYRRVLDRKIANLRATEADIIATSCPACIIHLSYGVRKHGLKTRVCHISEIINGI
ncbi:MAG: (Fe-S)-binding protein [Desulfobacterales bacterium]